MKKTFFIIMCLCVLIGSCGKKDTQKSCFVTVESYAERYNLSKRDSKDYIKFWINDSLYFSGLYRTSYDSVWDTYFGTDVANFVPQTDSVKMRIRIISLDSVLFGNKRIIDTVFHYKVKDIPAMIIVTVRPYENFSVFDFVNHPGCFELGG